MFKSWRIEP